MSEEGFEIWDYITNSAKRRFDYSTLEEQFSFDSDWADIILWDVIVGFAGGKKKDIIALEIHTKLIGPQVNWEVKNILQFLDDKEKLFQLEILASRMATEMFYNGGKPAIILTEMTRLLQ